MLAALQAPDQMARRFAIQPFEDLLPGMRDYRAQSRARKQAKTSAKKEAEATRLKTMRRSMFTQQISALNTTIARAVGAPDGFRERLTTFWADHFTVVGKQPPFIHASPSYVEQAIRPYISGHFADLLKAAVTHPMMLLYLDQVQSTGPGSKAGKGGKRGLNENLAREVMELHTLGVGGAYSQDDVRQLAELFTGMTARLKDGFLFRPAMAEPGSETILGKSYGGGTPGLNDIHAVLEDLARHPDTARHIARKLAVHFVSDDPDPALIDHVAAAYGASDGALIATYAALLDHPAAWSAQMVKARQPFDYIAAAIRALGVSPDVVAKLSPKLSLNGLSRPMQAMGQQWQRPAGPDGWPEDAAHWITPQGMAARIEWAMKVPSVLQPDLPDPRAFVQTALGARASEQLLFAARAAETRDVGIGLVLVSPDFQRR